MGPKRPRSVVLDAGALIAFEKNDRRVRTLVELAARENVALHAPAGVVGQVWRDGKRQARLARLIGSGVVRIQALDTGEAQAAGKRDDRRYRDPAKKLNLRGIVLPSTTARARYALDLESIHGPSSVFVRDGSLMPQPAQAIESVTSSRRSAMSLRGRQSPSPRGSIISCKPVMQRYHS